MSDEIKQGPIVEGELETIQSNVNARLAARGVRVRAVAIGRNYYIAFYDPPTGRDKSSSIPIAEVASAADLANRFVDDIMTTEFA